MDRPGKLVYKKLSNFDITAVKEFCNSCSKLGWENNASLEAMKFSSADFFGAYDNDVIVSLAGVHQLSEVNNHAWRCLFRGAQLPGYTPMWSRNIFNSGIHFSQFLYMQIKYVQTIDPDAEFYISTNINSSTGGKSSKMNSIMMPRLSKQGFWDLHKENYMLYNVPQNLWKINVSHYMSERSKWLESITR